MKKIILSISLIFSIGISMAQQVPLYSQYYYNQFLYNPAMAGYTSTGTAYAIHRNQWNNIPGAPQTTAFTVDGALANTNVGLGFSAYNDVIGIFNTTGANVTYAYKVQLSKGYSHNIRFGLSVGMFSNNINMSRVRVNDGADPFLMQYEPRNNFDASAGVMYNYKKLQLGLAVPQMFASKLRYNDPNDVRNTFYSLSRHYMISASYPVQVVENIRIIPLVMVRAVKGAPAQYDINVMGEFYGKYWIGAMYRSNFAFTVSAGARISEKFIVGYSYDIPVTNLRQYMKGTHEIMLGFRFGNATAEGMGDANDEMRKVKDRLAVHDKKIDSLSQKTTELTKKDKELTQKDSAVSRDIEEIKKEIVDLKSFKESGNTPAVGQNVVMTGTYFETGGYIIKSHSYDELNDLAAMLLTNPTMEIELSAHTDDVGDNNFNQKLSDRRANAVKNYLVSAGVSANRIKAVGYGESKPLADNKTEEGRNVNRRVEFKVTKK